MARNLVTFSRARLGQSCLQLRNDLISLPSIKRSHGRLAENTSRVTSSADDSRSSSSTSSSSSSTAKTIIDFAKIKSGPSLEYFLANKQKSPADTNSFPSASSSSPSEVPYLDHVSQVDFLKKSGVGKTVYFETYGCQMNVNDTEIVWSILRDVGYSKTTTPDEADVVFLMTCAIREGAEQKIWKRLKTLEKMKRRRETNERETPTTLTTSCSSPEFSSDCPIDSSTTTTFATSLSSDSSSHFVAPSSTSVRPLQLGVLGCMAERLKTRLVEETKVVDVVCGPDAYRDLPRMLASTPSGHAGVNVLLSLDETYADVMPVRLDSTGISAFVSIMRGCDNMCTYCIVPFTRGRERSRPIDSIVDEVKVLRDQGVKEVMLLGQNVNSYRDLSGVEGKERLQAKEATKLSNDGFRTVYKSKLGGRRFADLLDRVSAVDPEMRVRFTSPHPKDFPAELLDLINERPNICNYIHLPAQSGNDKVLDDMRRGYTRDAYLQLVEDIRSRIPDVSLSSDFISGFCGETEEAHLETLDLIRRVKYSFCFAFPYSMREKTGAHRRLSDDVPEEIKKRRHMEVVDAFRAEALALNQSRIGEKHLVLVEGRSKKSEHALVGRNDAFVKVVFPKTTIPSESHSSASIPSAGDYVLVEILDATSLTLIGSPICFSSIATGITSAAADFAERTLRQDVAALAAR